MIQLGKRSTLCTLLAVAALSISANAYAQNPPTPPPDPATSDPNAPPANPPMNPTPAPETPPPAAPPVAPTPPPEPPKTTFPTMAGPMLRLNDVFAIRPGMFLQFWAAGAQDQVPQATGDTGGFAKNLYLRRARFYLFGSIGKQITWFLLWESANLGQALIQADGSVNKNYTQLSGLGTAYGFNDAWADFKINDNVSIQAGLMLIPFTRNILQSTATYWTIDVGAVSATYIGVTQTNILRDTGLQLKINAVEGHLEARALVSQGVKQPDPTAPPGVARSAGKNDPRVTGFLQYNFFDPDSGYVFNGQYFGRKKIVALALGGDYQSINGDNPYFATSSTLFAAIPVNGTDPKGGDEVGGQVEYLHFHGGGAAVGSAASGLGKRDGLLVEAGYYNKEAKMSGFAKFEGVFLQGMNAAGIANDIGDTRLFGVGVKYFLAEAAANLTLQYNYTMYPNQPDDPAMRMLLGPLARVAGSTIQAQLQIGYF